MVRRTLPSSAAGKKARSSGTSRPGGARLRPDAIRTRLDVDERRAQLVEVGLEHFGSRRYDDVSIDAIAADAGISKGLLYHYFPTKRAFYAATVREAAARLIACTDEADEAAADARPLERLHAGLDAYLDYVAGHAKAFAALMKSGVGVDPEIARIVEGARESFVARLTSGFTEDAGRAGPSGEPLPPTPLVRIALRGWVALAEAVSLEWAETLDAEADRAAPSRIAVRDLLASALLEIAQKAAVSR